MMRLILALLLALGLASAAQAQPAFPELAGQPVVDAANILDPEAEAALNQALFEFEARNERQFAIATIPDLQGYDIAEYGYQLGRAWGLGDAERNDGIILIVAPNERQMRIEVGYGLEGILPDGLAFEYVEQMKPYFRDGDYAAGIAVGTQAIITQLELPPEEAARIAQQVTQARQSEGGVPVGGLIWLGVLVFFFVLPALFGSDRKRRYRGGGRGGLSGAGVVGDIILWEAGKAIARGLSDNDDWGGGGGGWGGGGGFGGGFGGGGGSFGGGGASGGW